MTSAQRRRGEGHNSIAQATHPETAPARVKGPLQSDVADLTRLQIRDGMWMPKVSVKGLWAARANNSRKTSVAQAETGPGRDPFRVADIDKASAEPDLAGRDGSKTPRGEAGLGFGLAGF